MPSWRTSVGLPAASHTEPSMATSNASSNRCDGSNLMRGLGCGGGESVGCGGGEGGVGGWSGGWSSLRSTRFFCSSGEPAMFSADNVISADNVTQPTATERAEPEAGMAILSHICMYAYSFPQGRQANPSQAWPSQPSHGSCFAPCCAALFSPLYKVSILYVLSLNDSYLPVVG